MKVTSAEFNCHTDSSPYACIATFKVEKDGLPDPHSLLATVPSSSIASGVQAVRESLLAYLIVKKGGSYAKYTPEQKALIAKKAAEHGVVHRFYLKRIDLAFEIVLRADPSLTRFDSTKILPQISLFSTIHEIITPQKICAIRY